MQVKFSTFIIALSVLTYLFEVAIASPIPTTGGSPRSSLIRLNSGPATLSSQTHSSRPSSPAYKPYVHDKPYPMVKEPVLTLKEKWHQPRARKWENYTGQTKETAKESGNKAVQSVKQGNFKEAVKNAGKSCIMGLVCGGAAAAKAIHAHKANKPGP